MLRLTWIVIFLFVLPYIAGMTGMHYHAQPFVEMMSHEYFAQASLEPPSF
jgi:hypothetical protein